MKKSAAAKDVHYLLIGHFDWGYLEFVMVCSVLIVMIQEAVESMMVSNCCCFDIHKHLHHYQQKSQTYLNWEQVYSIDMHYLRKVS